MTLEQSQQTDLPQMELPLTQSVEDFPAKTSAVQEKALVLKANVAAYGLNTPELLASYDHDTSSWRTSQHCLVEGLTVFSGRWPRSGMMQNGIAYQLQPLVPLTDETDCGLLPTPLAGNTKAINQRSGDREPMNFLKPLPTPRASDYKGATSPLAAKKAKDRGFTPNLPEAISEISGGGQLNPMWVEWLMGFPLGHTDLER